MLARRDLGDGRSLILASHAQQEEHAVPAYILQEISAPSRLLPALPFTEEPPRGPCPPDTEPYAEPNS
jgi:hypothetical protein